MYDPTMYDLMTSASQGGDVDWYLGLARQTGGPVLELGAGTGRVVVPMAEAGFQIDALEYDAGMCEALRRRLEALPEETQNRIRVIAGDSASLRWTDDTPRYRYPFARFCTTLPGKIRLPASAVAGSI